MGNQSKLVTPSPYHLPGYGGFCPEYRFQCADTFGRTTHKLLTNRDVATSGTSILTDLSLPQLSKSGSLVADEAELAKKRIIRSRPQREGNQKFLEDITPGYSGFIPHHEKFFAETFHRTSNDAICDFELADRSLRERRFDLDRHSQRPVSLSADSIKMKPLATRQKPYVSKSQLHYVRSPYRMSHDDPEKYFMSGYAGCVPRSRYKHGSSFPKITNESLVQFSDELQRIQAVKREPVRLDRFNDRKKGYNPAVVYPVDSGLIPHYSGHIPGEKYRLGACFNRTTTNARGLAATV